jgi:hypothetical protein
MLTGAGNGSGPLVQYLLERGKKSVLLIEPDPARYRQLEQQIANRNGWQLIPKVLAPASGPVRFHQANLKTESGLVDPAKLSRLWPNLSCVDSEFIEASNLLELLRECTTTPNWLFIDFLPAQPLIESLGQKIDGIEVMIARVVLNECDLPDENADLTALVTFMAAKKFRWLFTQPSRHAGLGHALFIHDTAGHLRVFLDEYANSESPKNKFTTIREIEKLAQAQISTLKHENAELQNKVESVLAKALAQETQIEKYASIENAEKLAQAQISTLKHENAELQNKVESVLAKALAQETLNDTEKRLHDKFTKIIANSTKQIESFIRIQSILGSEYMGDFHGWPISPDIGLFLLERMREQHYDLIIEFGSGTSTMMLARMSQVLAKKSTVMDKKRDSTHKTSNSKTTIVSFEHHEHYWKKTRQLLKAHRLGKLVELVHAPLQDWHDDTQAYRYYDCHKTLEALAQKNANRKLRILMLVDGPPGSTCVNARYPAVPIVFRALKGHYIDVILDDANRADEKRTIELWQQFWKRQSKHFVDQHIATEKGLYLASVS